MVVAQEKLAAQIGADILRQGGNAVDAAVATGFALAVTYPRAGNIGGGGFMVIHSAERSEDVAIDYRETAPAATTRDIFLGADGKPDTAKSRNSALGIGVPGTVAGLGAGAGEIRLGQIHAGADLCKPAIELARDGFVVADDMADTLPDMYRRMARWPNSAKAFSRADGTPLREGDTADPDRSRGDAVGDCRAGTARILRRAGRRKAGEGDPRRRRHHDGGRSEILSGRDPRAGARQLSRLRHRLDAAALVRRHVLLETLNILEGFPMARHEAGLARPRCMS